MNRLSVLCGAAVAALALVSSADAGLIIDVRVMGGSDAHTKSVTPGEVVTLEVHGLVTGAAGNASAEGLQTISGAYVSTGSLKGTISAFGAMVGVPDSAAGVGINGFNGNSSRVGSKVDLDGDGDIDLGKLGTNGTMASVQRANNMVYSGATGVTDITDGIDVCFGKITFTVPADASGSSLITWSGTTANVQLDGVVTNITATMNTALLGTPIGSTLSVPEPGTLGLLGVSAVGMLIRRRSHA